MVDFRISSHPSADLKSASEREAHMMIGPMVLLIVVECRLQEITLLHSVFAATNNVNDRRPLQTVSCLDKPR